ncbi:glutamate receptor 2.7-like [Cryptomeria japonica]|uniref:glutamate receptor 2.7-like n=1 Tax=Cryptomeria japonica TaxID=3369 RepID=UPI0027DA4EE6|nr:glutamate receptor 2.7-like [Cryptomeria japonica]
MNVKDTTWVGETCAKQETENSGALGKRVYKIRQRKTSSWQRRRLDYELAYELIPYGTGNVTAGYYDDVVYQVYLQKFDAVVGDMTVLANRSKYVDLTQPYTESGLIMMVALSDKLSSDPWAFLRPFTPAMWITTVSFFIFTGAVVWCLEHRLNRQFRGKPWEQVLTFMWFSFSTLLATQRERIVSGLGKAVVIIWLFLGVDESALRPYSSAQESADVLKKGPNNGGVAAIFERARTIPQNVILSTACNDYVKLGPKYTTGGSAFVFPKGSPFVSDISKAILNLSESKEMQEILKRWFNSSENKCSVESGGVESNKMSIKNFWGIFLLTGCVSFLTLVYYLCRLLYRFVHRNENSVHVKSVSTRLRTFANYADKKEIPTPKRKRSKTATLSSGTAASTSSEIPVSTGQI